MNDRKQIGGDHYETMGVQPWDFFAQNSKNEEILAACKQNILKYIMRDKGNKAEDWAKALWYLKRGIEILEKP